jgi:RimJ/RimL family protein N-acetyltransferase
MNKTSLAGKLVRLVADDPKTLAERYTRWSRDSEYWRLMDSGITRPVSQKAMEKFLEGMLEDNPLGNFSFSVYTLADQRLIGDVGMSGFAWAQGDCFVGISLGEREFWGRGYGTDAMRVLLGYAFQELNLHRVSLNVFDYNPRAIRSYEKVGFRHEGRVRQALKRDGRRWDMLFMGILREEWQLACEPE